MKSFFLILATSVVCSSLAFAQVLTRQKIEEATQFCAKEMMSDLFDQFKSDRWYISGKQDPSIVSGKTVKIGVEHEAIYLRLFEVSAVTRENDRARAFVFQNDNQVSVRLWQRDCFAPRNLQNGSVSLTSDLIFPAVEFRSDQVKKKFDDFGRALSHLDEIEAFEVVGPSDRVLLKNEETRASSKFSLDLGQYKNCLKTQLDLYLSQETTGK